MEKFFSAVILLFVSVAAFAQSGTKVKWDYTVKKLGDKKYEVRMIANLCEISPDDVRKMPLRDYARLQAGVALFTT